MQLSFVHRCPVATFPWGADMMCSTKMKRTPCYVATSSCSSSHQNLHGSIPLSQCGLADVVRLFKMNLRHLARPRCTLNLSLFVRDVQNKIRPAIFCTTVRACQRLVVDNLSALPDPCRGRLKLKREWRFFFREWSKSLQQHSSPQL